MDNTFRTILQSQPSPIQIEHQSGVLCMGSCFAAHIGHRLQHYKFENFLNPFGIVYNPISIAKGLEILLEEELFFDKKNIFEYGGGWHSFQHHSSFSHPDQEVVLEKINNTLTEARSILKNAEFLILTIGTANVFVEEKTGRVVANCHKVPQRSFIKKKLSADETTLVLDDIFRKINSRFPHLKIITTVSPIRHIRNGLIESQVSKAKLLVALDTLSELHPFVGYFPAYEILLDDLRDYRFYKKDMIHPNEVAIDYIWDFFSKTFFSKKTLELNDRIHKIKMAAAHRPFHAKSAGHLEFVKNQLEKIKEMEKEFPFLNFEEEVLGIQDDGFKIQDDG